MGSGVMTYIRNFIKIGSGVQKFIWEGYTYIHKNWWVGFMKYATEMVSGAMIYKVIQIWPGLIAASLHTNSPGHIWITLYIPSFIETGSGIPKSTGGIHGHTAYFYFFFQNKKKNKKNSFRMVGVSAEIRTEYVQNTNQLAQVHFFT
jgi:hypothetical protein